MAITPEPKNEHPSTYFVQDRSSLEELTRLHLQDALITISMGGVLPEQPDLRPFQRILDVGCGTGGWLIELAKTAPTSRRLVGVDVSRTFVEYARAQAEAAQVSDRVEFYAMDALRMLEFPNHFFDLVNLRFGVSWLRTWDWPKILQEMQRVCHPDGVIRLTESELGPESPSPTLTHLSGLSVDAFFRAGHLFWPQKDGITWELASVLKRHGVEQIQTHSYALEYRANTTEWQSFCEDIRLGLQAIVPFLRKWARLPDDYAELTRQAIREIHQANFVATVRLLTVWGKPSLFEEGANWRR